MVHLILIAAILNADYLPKGNTVGTLVNILYGLVGGIAVIYIIWAGIQMMIAAGNSEKVATARRNIVYVFVGLIIIMISWPIVGYILEKTTN